MSSKPAGTSMEGMIFNANAILEKAISSSSNGISKSIVDECHCVVLLSVVQAGAVFSGSVGSGIILSRDPVTKTWSLPCACSLSGIGFGLLVGGSHTDFMVFVLDKDTMTAFTKGDGFRCSGQATATLGDIGRNQDLDIDPTKNSVVTVSFSKGAFAGVSIEGAMIRPNGKANHIYYGAPVNSHEILEKDTPLAMPANKVTLIEEVYKKLNILAEGETAEPDEAEKVKVVEAKKVADTAGEESKKDPDVVEVDAKAEAEKEKAAA